MERKPLGHKSYGHIAHLPGSRVGIGDHKCHEGQLKIACKKKRDKWDRIIVQEKLDGSNVGVALINGQIIAISRAGYLANTSPYIQHHFFNAWVKMNEKRFRNVLQEGERLCGEWLLIAHGTIYNLPHEPFVAFDIIQNKHQRLPYADFFIKVQKGDFIIPALLSSATDYTIPISIEEALRRLDKHGFHGAQDLAEGCIWRIERDELIDKHKGNAGGRKTIVDFLVKYVRPNKEDGKYLKRDDRPESKHIYNTHK
ncbi:MAG: RNA ligase family protein [Candidatus Thorarchaeota archaeon]